MTHTVVAEGDAMDSLSELARRVAGPPGPHDDEDLRRVRGLVVGVNLLDLPSSRRVRAELKRRVMRLADDVRRYPAAVHVLVAYRLPAGVAPERVLHTADAIALQLHATLERRAARYVDVTLLDVTACSDAVLLADRITERIAGKAGAYSSVALAWSDIRDLSIARATMADYY